MKLKKATFKTIALKRLANSQNYKFKKITIDGVEYEYDSLIEGSDFTTIVDGEIVIPDQLEVDIEDKVVVIKDGVIVEIKDKNPEEPEDLCREERMETEELELVIDPATPDITQTIADMLQKIEALEKAIEDIEKFKSEALKAQAPKSEIKFKSNLTNQLIAL